MSPQDRAYLRDTVVVGVGAKVISTIGLLTIGFVPTLLVGLALSGKAIYDEHQEAKKRGN